MRAALGEHDIYCMASGMHLDPMFGKGGLSSPSDKVRDEAIRRTLEGVDFSAEVEAHFIIWPGIEGYNYPFQTPYAEIVGAVRRRDRAGGAARRRSAA